MKIKNPLNLRTALAASALAGAIFSSSASAAIIVNNLTNIAPTGGTAGAIYDPAVSGTPLIPVSSTDLIQGLTPVVTYTGPGGTSTNTAENSTGVSAWTNGSISTVYQVTGNNTLNHAAYGTVGATTGVADRDVLVTYDLGNFFNLTQINVILGWNDSGRDDSSFNVLVSTDNITFNQIASYAKGADNTGAITTPVTNFHGVSDDGGGYIASGVRYVQITFTDADNGFAGVSEIDVIGQAVPEASTALLGVLGGLALLKRRRR